MAYFEIDKRPNGEFWFVLRNAGGKALLNGEGGYRTKDNCKKGIDSVRRNCSDPSKFEVLNLPSGRTYFILKSVNGRTIGASEHFMDDASRELAMRAVRKTASQGKLNDLTRKPAKRK
jgi:uncharacterized protein YegP (UPF0339 family)